jgi:hypothetical protein
MVSFCNAEEMKKGRSIAVISKYRWYYIFFSPDCSEKPTDRK